MEEQIVFKEVTERKFILKGDDDVPQGTILVNKNDFSKIKSMIRDRNRFYEGGDD